MKQLIFSILILGFISLPFNLVFSEATPPTLPGLTIKSTTVVPGTKTTKVEYSDGSYLTIMPNEPNPPVMTYFKTDGSQYRIDPTTGQSTQTVQAQTPTSISGSSLQNQEPPKTPTNVEILDRIVSPGDIGIADDKSLGKLLNQLFYAGLVAAVILAIVMIIRGGVEYMTIDAISSKENGKNRIKAALGGLLLAFSAILILNTINPGLTSLNIKFEALKNIQNINIFGGLISGTRDPVTGEVVPVGVVYRDSQGRVIITENGVAKLDTDGSPGTYKVTEVPAGTPGSVLINGKYYTSSGNTSLAMAGKPGNWWGVKTDNGRTDGNPIINPDGTLVPQLSWGNGTINGDQTPFVALSNGQLNAARQANPSFGLGQKVLLTANGKTIEAVYADNRGNREDGGSEISPAAAQALGLKWGAQGGKTWIEGNVTITLPD